MLRRIHAPTWIFLALGLTLAGCMSTRLRNKQLEHVAKDWSMVIRASQVIPVYPLTEDLQPGDVFLVQVPIDEQQRLYKKKGFLPLDNHVARIEPLGYAAFYEKSFGEADLPRAWLHAGDDEDAWKEAPTASFPTYSFSVKSGGGLSLAIPVKGVPVGLSLMGADAADGGVTIADARSYGLDMVSLYDDLRRWSRQHRDFLRHFESTKGKKNYLRVVSRVYLTGRVDISMKMSSSASGGLDAGAPKPVDLMFPKTSDDTKANTAEAYEANLKKINDSLAKALEKVEAVGGGAATFLPGGSVKVVSASARSIALAETFSRPLVLGYLGFDVVIGKGGALGAPIPTLAMLDERALEPSDPDANLSLMTNAALSAAYGALDAMEDDKSTELVAELDELETLVPPALPCSIFGQTAPGGPLTILFEKGATTEDLGEGFDKVSSYRGQVALSTRELERVLKDPSASVDGFSERNAETEAYLRDNLRENQAAHEGVMKGLGAASGLLEDAMNHVTRMGL